MLTEIYIEALLVDEELADQVWEAWDAGEIDDDVATCAWWLIVESLANQILQNSPFLDQLEFGNGLFVYRIHRRIW